MKFVFILALFIALEPVFAGISKVICESNGINHYGVKETADKRINDEIGQVSYEGFKEVSAPSLSQVIIKNEKIETTICVTVTKP